MRDLSPFQCFVLKQKHHCSTHSAKQVLPGKLLCGVGQGEPSLFHSLSQGVGEVLRDQLFFLVVLQTLLISVESTHLVDNFWNLECPLPWGNAAFTWNHTDRRRQMDDIRFNGMGKKTNKLCKTAAKMIHSHSI